ncbi:oligogalacturonate lyase family protein [Halosimplex salinum]|uniref:oligogalacturonate lyase family protein n=1 Tax=Halosimplex salinum TaxID=1710538 RepID=UPI000F48B2C5|nr:oligogalacturonate lyase family protein [Halosimplex salinum]
MPETIEQGPRAGSHWPAEDETYADPTSGARVRRLTSYPGVGDYHLYFTEDGWYDGGRRLLFRSDRTGSRQLHSIDLESGLITQVTDVEGFRGGTSIDHDAELVYFWARDRLVSLDLGTLRVEGVHYEVPDGWTGGSFDVNADGSRLYVAIGEDVEVPERDDKLSGTFEAAPDTRILSVPTDGGEPERLREVDVWASSHVNASPTRPDLFTYCEEGPWDAVENRIWSVNAETGETWKVREVPDAGGVGHEYWMQDGERVGYHGSLKDPQGRERVDDPEPFIGSSRYDDTDRRETALPDEVYALTHTHANSPELLVCDGTFEAVPHSLLYRWDEAAGEYEGPRVLATHDWDHAGPHPHSRFSPDGSHVLFDSARYDGSSNLYLAEVPEFEDLPEYESD